MAATIIATTSLGVYQADLLSLQAALARILGQLALQVQSLAQEGPPSTLLAAAFFLASL